MTDAPDAPLLVEHVTGYRVFRLGPDVNAPAIAWTGGVVGADQDPLPGTARLWSQYADAVWSDEPGHWMTAVCDPGGGYVSPVEDRLHPGLPAPQRICSCGLHAHHSLSGTPSGEVWVTGLVVAEGRIVPHHDGFRAERMSVRALHDPQARAGLSALARRMRVPVVTRRSALEDLAGEFGSPVPESLRPTAPPPRALPSAPPYPPHLPSHDLVPTVLAGAAVALLADLALTRLYRAVHPGR